MVTRTDAPVSTPSTGGATRTELAYERTRIASERTLMAWIRTAVSLIGFGFSIPKFFEYMRVVAPTRPVHGSPVRVGMWLIGLGTLSLAAGMIEHMSLERRLSSRGHPRWSVALATSFCVLAFGIYAFANILHRE